MTRNGARYDDLRALYFNCTLKRSPERSNTQGLIDVSAAISQFAREYADQNQRDHAQLVSAIAAGAVETA